jgi:hypothetical protein
MSRIALIDIDRIEEDTKSSPCRGEKSYVDFAAMITASVREYIDNYTICVIDQDGVIIEEQRPVTFGGYLDEVLQLQAMGGIR